MSQFTDPFEELPITIDVGGQLYYLGSEKPVELTYKSRADFNRDFGTDTEVERLLRKYLFVSLKDKRRLRFDSPDEKQELIKILKNRAAKIKASQEFTSSVLKNTMLQRSYVGIQQLIGELEGPLQKGFLNDIQLPGMPDIVGCDKAKKVVVALSNEKRNELVLAMAYFLLHPDRVPKDVECDWAKLVRDMDSLNLSDVMEQIVSLRKGKLTQTGETPMNAFRQLGLQSGGGPIIKSALDDIKELALQVRGESTKKNVEERIRALRTVTEIQNVLDRPIASSHFATDIISGPDAEKLNVLNKKRVGGGGNELEKPLGNAMRPLYDYFKVVYDPIYTFLESGVMRNGPDMKTIMLPQLLTLLYICNSIKPQETTDGGAMSYGIYRITNVSDEVLAFINGMLVATENQVEKFSDDKDKRTFTLQVSSLPKVRLSTILNSGTVLYKESDLIPNIQFFTVNNNLILPNKDDFIYEGGKEVVYEALTELFNERDLYIICSKAKDFATTVTNVPMNVFEVNFDEIKVDSDTFKYTIPDTYFNQKKNQEVDLTLEKLVQLKDYVIYNDAELALSIFMALKLTLPK